MGRKKERGEMDMRGEDEIGHGSVKDEMDEEMGKEYVQKVSRIHI